MPARPDWEERGRRLREARIAKGLDQNAVVQKTGINRSTLSKLENGKGGITEDKARKLGPVVGVDPEDLMSVASPSMLSTVREVERMLRTLVPEQPALELEARKQDRQRRAGAQQTAVRQARKKGQARP